MSDTLVMNSLNLGVSPKVGESVYFPPSQKAIKESAAESTAGLPSLPDTSTLEEDKTYKLKWNSVSKVFEWVEG